MSTSRPPLARTFFAAALAAQVACLSATPANAQSASLGAPASIDRPQPTADTNAPGTAEPASEWHFSLIPYLWVPSVNGNLTVNGNALNLDSGFFETGDSSSGSINFAAMVRAELSHDRLSLFGDCIYLDLDAARQGALANQDARLKLGIYELGAAYSILETPSTEQGSPRLRLEPLAGIRIYDVDARITGSGGGLNTSNSAAWVDGFVGGRARFDFNSTLSLSGRGDVGGGGSDLTWSASGELDVRVSQMVSIELGYRAMSADYTKGRGASLFNYDLLLHGPFLAVTIRF